MYAAKVDRNGHLVRAYDARSFTKPAVQVSVSGNLLSVQDAQGRLFVCELPRGSLKYQR